jgi:hypothetical protein
MTLIIPQEHFPLSVEIMGTTGQSLQVNTIGMKKQ